MNILDGYQEQFETAIAKIKELQAENERLKGVVNDSIEMVKAIRKESKEKNERLKSCANIVLEAFDMMKGCDVSPNMVKAIRLLRNQIKTH